ncbi:hypothetical protein TcasGA2_TC030949 [Tribolium castaneum]|uniref:Uncharacterized protein n=1 Tax=Tribolium castaneum TaxID=7070 RepID=A0A139WAE2_TRICA|nr:hypothetical protein TcasGA2_TC030949 [Tribolium castaneum]
MLVVLLCCMMKIVEFSTGKPVGKPRVRRRRKYVRRKATHTPSQASLLSPFITPTPHVLSKEVPS